MLQKSFGELSKIIQGWDREEHFARFSYYAYCIFQNSNGKRSTTISEQLMGCTEPGGEIQTGNQATMLPVPPPGPGPLGPCAILRT